ncbi:MAG: dihydrofolate reductase [Candidatus Pacebacteria bacterium]|nr:dihydrofolate reductase [Candidatus Paceibacterota bacterium]
MKKPLVYAVVAIGAGHAYNGGLGKDGKLLWHIPDDLKRFRQLTKGHPIIFGRKTFESILQYTNGKPLPDRVNIVVTRDQSWSFPDVVVASSVEEALAKAAAIDPEAVSIGGGGQIYKEALPYIQKLYLTLIDDEKEADSFFPPYEDQFTKKTSEEEHEWNGLKYKWVDLERENV